MDGWMDGRTDRWMDGWTDRRTDVHTYIHTYIQTDRQIETDGWMHTRNLQGVRCGTLRYFFYLNTFFSRPEAWQIKKLGKSREEQCAY